MSQQTTIMKLLNKKQIREWDQTTISSKNISSFDLMKKASNSFCQWFQSLFFDMNQRITVLCGPGNNGGDGLCVSKILSDKGYLVDTYLFIHSKTQSPDNESAQFFCGRAIIWNDSGLPLIDNGSIIIDALFGSGISGELRNPYNAIVSSLNALPNTVVSIDISSGLDVDGKQVELAVRADHVLSFEIPKRAFFYDENQKYVKSWTYRSIGLANSYLSEADSLYHFLDRKSIKTKIEKRSSAASKVQFGFGHLCGGSEGMYGAVILAARSAMRCGIGRLAVSLPKKYEANFIAVVPEVMTYADDCNETLSVYKRANRSINVVAAGPGLGMSKASTSYIDSLLSHDHEGLVLDADALNIIARQKWQTRIPENAILTPHEAEFERLFGACENHYLRVEKQRSRAIDLGIYIVLKGSHTSIATPDGACYFNATGNVGMATAGSGDVLTGMIMSFLAQDYTPLDACALGVYVHGLAGDQARLKYGELSMIASDIIEFVPETLKNIYES